MRHVWSYSVIKVANDPWRFVSGLFSFYSIVLRTMVYYVHAQIAQTSAL